MDRSEDFQYTPIVLGYLERDHAVLLTRRPAGVPQADRWEFPGGKAEPGESLPDALRRELREELGVTVAVGEELAVVRYDYPEIRVELHLFRCTITAGTPAPLQASELCWAPVAALPTLDFPPANTALLAALNR